MGSPLRRRALFLRPCSSLTATGSVTVAIPRRDCGERFGRAALNPYVSGARFTFAAGAATIMGILYSVVVAFAALLAAPWYLLRSGLRGFPKGYWSERLGRVPESIRAPKQAGSIWIHA